VQAMIVSLQTAAPYVQSGKLRMLAVMSAERSQAFSDVPTLRELGLADLEVETWYGVFAPAGTPQAAIARVNAEMNALLKLDARIDLVHVPYKGSGGALADLVGGHVQAMIVSLQTAAPYVQSGKLRMLAVMSAERSQAFSEVPTLKESGLADLEVETWYGVFAPAGTPQAAIARVNAEMNALLKQNEIRELLARQGMAPAGGTPERFGDLVQKELARWLRVVAAAGIKAD